MRPYPLSFTPPHPVPSSIWMPALFGTRIPACYQGSPVEMVQAMGSEMLPGLNIQETIDRLVHTLAESSQIRIRIGEGPDVQRAHLFVTALLITGVAKPMPSA